MLFSFEKTFGEGVDPWYDKAERWVKKKFKNPFVQHLALGFIEWLKQQWIEVKVANAMKDIDKQTEQIKKIWEEQDVRREPIIVEKGVLGDEGSWHSVRKLARIHGERWQHQGRRNRNN